MLQEPWLTEMNALIGTNSVLLTLGYEPTSW